MRTSLPISYCPLRQTESVPNHYGPHAYRSESSDFVFPDESDTIRFEGGRESVGGRDEDIRGRRWCEGVLGREWVECDEDLPSESGRPIRKGSSNNRDEDAHESGSDFSPEQTLMPT